MARDLELRELRAIELELTPETRAERVGRLYEINRNRILGTLATVAFLVLWEWIGYLGAKGVTLSLPGFLLSFPPPLFISSPSRIYAAGYKLFASGEILPHLQVSGTEFALGFAGAIAIGIPLGMLVGWYKAAFAAFNPFISAMYATPRIALLPLIIIWVGIGIWSKVAVVFLGAVFPIIVTTMTAMQTLDPSLLRAARSFGAGDREIFQTIALPASFPFILAGLRLGAGRGLVGIVVGELYAANAGVGYIIAVYGSTFQTDKLFVGVMIIAIAGIAVVEMLQLLEKRFDAWRPRQVE